MKLVFLSNQQPPVVDGVGDYTALVAAELALRGHEVHVVCSRNEKISTGMHQGVVVWPLVESWTPDGFAKASERIKLLQPQVVLLQYVPYGFNKWGLPLRLPALVRTLARQYKLLLMVHEPYIRLQWRPVKTWVIGQLQRLVLQQLCRAASTIFTSINRYLELIGLYTSKPVVLVPVPSNIPPVPVTPQEVAELRNSIAPGGEKIVVTFGIRDHELLINAFSQLLELQPHTKLLVTGVVRQQEVYAAIQNKVHITGFLPAVEVYRYLKTADVFFLPDPIRNGNEGGASNKSGSLAAAFAADLPIVGTKGDMNNALLNEAPAVFLEEAHPEKIAHRLAAILNSPARKGNSRFWQEHLSIEAVATVYENELEKLSLKR